MPAGLPSAQPLDRRDRYPVPTSHTRWQGRASLFRMLQWLADSPFLGGPGQGTRQIVELFVALGLTAIVGLEREIQCKSADPSPSTSPTPTTAAS